MAEAWIIDAVRSPRGKGKDTGALHHVHPQRILAQVLTALQQRNGFDTADVDDVIWGTSMQLGTQSGDLGRMAAQVPVGAVTHSTIVELITTGRSGDMGLGHEAAIAGGVA